MASDVTDRLARSDDATRISDEQRAEIDSSRAETQPTRRATVQALEELLVDVCGNGGGGQAEISLNLGQQDFAAGDECQQH